MAKPHLAAATAADLTDHFDPTPNAIAKDLYAIGEIPPLGHVPRQMHAYTIRRDREGEPESAMRDEIVATPEIDPDQVLVMAAWVNYNGVWAVGARVKRWRVGDEVVIHCHQDDGDDPECNGGDPMFSPSQRIWGYETPDGSFAQFTAVQGQQLMPRPRHLTWEESGCYVLTLATAYRMLFGHRPHILRPGHNVLVWGAAGSLGSIAIQLIATAGAHAIAVISDEEKRSFVTHLGATGAINRRDFDCWGQMPAVESAEYPDYMRRVRQFGKVIWAITGKGNDVDFVFEHPGEATFPVSTFVVKGGRMVLFCAGTTGYNISFDVRFVWMRQKRIQGSHLANLPQASQANQLVIERRIEPCMSEVFSWPEIPAAHTKMMNNKHHPGNMAVLVQALSPGHRSLEDVVADADSAADGAAF